jgi:hypothetical protein
MRFEGLPGIPNSTLGVGQSPPTPRAGVGSPTAPAELVRPRALRGYVSRGTLRSCLALAVDGQCSEGEPRRYDDAGVDRLSYLLRLRPRDYDAQHGGRAAQKDAPLSGQTGHARIAGMT